MKKQNKKTGFYDSWYFLMDHPAFVDDRGIDDFQRALDIHLAMVNPKTLMVDDNKTKNIKLQVWLECGKWYKDKQGSGYTHDIDLDCGADTFEEAIIKLGKLVRKHYGSY